MWFVCTPSSSFSSSSSFLLLLLLLLLLIRMKGAFKYDSEGDFMNPGNAIDRFDSGLSPIPRLGGVRVGVVYRQEGRQAGRQVVIRAKRADLDDGDVRLKTSPPQLSSAYKISIDYATDRLPAAFKEEEVGNKRFTQEQKKISS